MSTLAQLQVRDWYWEAEAARSEQLLMMPTELLTDREWLPGELLSGLEH